MIVYGTILFSWLVVALLYRFHLIRLEPILIVFIYLFGIAYGLTYEFTLGQWFGLYHYYKDPDASAYWILLMGVFSYPVYHVLYVNWAVYQRTFVNWLLYTMLCTAVLLFSEYWSVNMGVVVFTGWRIWPWSIVTYTTAFVGDTLIYSWMRRKLAGGVLASRP